MDPGDTTATRVWLDEEGIVRVVFKGVANTESSAAETLLEISRVAGRKAPVLFDTSNFTAADPQSWIRFTRGIADVANAAAVVVGEGVRGRYGGFLRAINSMLIPFEAFDDEAAAVAFLRSFLD